jgi:DNA-binding SARP family transcriptional activator
VQVAILGPVEVRRDDGSVVPIAGARLHALLARLALDAGRPVPAAALVDAVWGDEPPAEAANALQTLVSRLRRAAGDPSLVVQDGTGYRLAIGRDGVDAHRFAALAAAARHAWLLAHASDLRAGRITLEQLP